MLDALVKSGKLNVTIVKRESSSASFPGSVKVQTADLSSKDSVTAAFKGQDAVVSTVGTEGMLGQSTLIEAAVAAGVKRFLPSEFGCDTANTKAAAFPVFGYKIATHKALREAADTNPSFTYTNVCTSAFLDWDIEKNFILNWSESKPKIYDGGSNVFSATTLATIGQAVVGVLTHPEETKDRFVYVKDIDLTQNKLLEIAKKVAPSGKTWEDPIMIDTAQMEKSSYESVAKGDYSGPIMFAFLFRVLYGPAEYGAKFEKVDNELLGLKGKTEKDVEDIFRAAITGSK